MSEVSSDLKRVVSSSAIYVLAALAQRGVAFLLLPIYTRLIPTARYGILEVLSTFSSLAFALLMLGLPSAVNKCYHRDCDSEEKRRQVLTTAAWLGTPIVLAGTILLWFFAPMVSQLLLRSPNYSGLVRLAMVGGMLYSLNTLMLAGLRSQERALVYGILSFGQFTATMLLNVYFVVFLRMDVAGVLWGNLLGTALVLPITTLLAAQKAKFFPSSALAGPLLTFGILIVPAAVGGWVIDLSDRYLLTRLADLDQVGIYGVGYKVGMIIQLAIVWPFQLSWPAVSFSITSRPDYKDTYARTLTYLILALAYGSVGLSIASRVLLPHIVGEGFFDAYRVVPLVALAYSLNGVHFCVSPALHIAEKTRLLTILTILAAISNIVLNLLAIPRFGMMGAAWSTVFAFLVLAIGAIAFGQKFNPVPYEYARILKLILVTTTIFLLSSQTPSVLTPLSLIWQATLAVAGIPVGLLAIGFLYPTERAQLRALASLSHWRTKDS